MSCCRSWKDNVCQTKVARAHAALKQNLFIANPVLQVRTCTSLSVVLHAGISLGTVKVFAVVQKFPSLACCKFTMSCDMLFPLKLPHAMQKCNMCPERLHLAIHSTVHIPNCTSQHSWDIAVHSVLDFGVCGPCRNSWWQCVASAPTWPALGCSS